MDDLLCSRPFLLSGKCEPKTRKRVFVHNGKQFKHAVDSSINSRSNIVFCSTYASILTINRSIKYSLKSN